MSNSTVEITTVADAHKIDFSSIDAVKNMMLIVTEQVAINKTMMNSLRLILKDSEKNSKELDKLRNKKSRTKTERSPNALPSGITKPVAISEELSKFLGVSIGTLVPRNEVTKGVSGFVKSNNLSDPDNKQRFILDDRPAAKTLRALLGNPQENVTYFNLQRYLKHHYIIANVDDKQTATTPKAKGKTVTPELIVVPVVAEISTPVKKKIMVVKKKQVVELSEEA